MAVTAWVGSTCWISRRIAVAQYFRIRRRAHHQVRDVAGHLCLCQEHGGPWLRHQSVMPDVAHYSHDFCRFRVGPITDDALPDRVLVRGVLVYERLINQRHARAVDAVLPAEGPAPQNRDAHGGEVPAAHGGYVGFHASRIVGQRPSNEVKRPVIGPASEWKKLNRSNRAHFGRRLDSIQDALDQARAPGGIARDYHLHGQDLIRLETEFDFQKARKRAQKESRPDEEKHGERHLGHDKGVTKSLPAATVSAAPAVLLEGRLHVETGDAPGRPQPEHDGREKRERNGKSENARVETHILYLSERNRVLREEEKRAAGPRAKEETERSSYRGERDAFNEKLLNYPSTARAERCAQSQLASAADAARQEQAREVGARDQQDEGNHPEQQ